jgi:hypothetical protein
MMWDEEHATPWARAFAFAHSVEELERVAADPRRSVDFRASISATLPRQRERARKEVHRAAHGMWTPGKRHELTPDERDARIRELWEQGRRGRYIARAIGVSETTVCRRAEALGLDRPLRVQAWATFEADLLGEVRAEARRTGCSVTELLEIAWTLARDEVRRMPRRGEEACA